MAQRPELQIVRDVLAAVGPEASTALFDALERAGGDPPGTRAEVVEIVRAHLAVALAARGVAQAPALIAEIIARIEASPAVPDDAVDVDVDVEDFEEGKTTQMTAVPHPVSVLVASASESFANRLLAVLGEDRVYPFTVADETALRHATFSAAPLVLVVDATAPPAIDAGAMASAMRGLPRQTTPVVWSQDTDYGRALRGKLEQHHTQALFLSRTEGIEPLLDVVLSRRKQSSSFPPPKY